MPSLRKRQTAPASRGLEIGQPPGRPGIGEIGDGVEPLDRKAGIAVHDHPLGGCGLRGKIKAEGGEKACQ